MYVRVKVVRGKRYAYLVEGRREGRRVRQKVVRYLGPLARAALGVTGPDEMEGDDGSIDWRKVNLAITKIPLNFQELSEARRIGLPRAVAKEGRAFPSGGTRERVEGEEAALLKLASAKFRQAFIQVGELRYRMR